VLLQRFAAVIPCLIVVSTLSAQTKPKACPQVQAKNAKEALMMEGASDKQGCWSRSAKTGQLVFTGTSPTAYKPLFNDASGSGNTDATCTPLASLPTVPNL
jgi:hypothetical protein